MTYYDDSYRRRQYRCNQCGHGGATYYCKHTDEYLCEDCEAYTLKMVAEEENLEFEKDNAA